MLVQYALAGSLMPPGAPAPTMKTLAQVEPAVAVQMLSGSLTAVYTISQPGSYYLTANITGVSGKHGIEVTTDSVTIDLRGFSIQGVSGALDGIHWGGASDDTLGATVVHDGVVEGWGGSGVSLRSNCQVRNVIAKANRQWGIDCQMACLVQDCTARGNNIAGNAGGIRVTHLSAVRRCLSHDNMPAVDNGNSYGVHAGGECVVTESFCCNNYGRGTGFGYGIYLVSGQATMNTCTSNGGGNGGGDSYGIYANSSAVVQGNKCSANQAGGAGKACGIFVSAGQCSVLGNTCFGNVGGSGNGCGIQIYGSSCQVDSNLCANNAAAGGSSYGIWIGSVSGCTIVKNRTSDHTTAGIRFENTALRTNYCGENLMHDSAGVSEATPGANAMGTGDRANIAY
jgi:hypothetical protein